jgi:HSP20 family protein
MRLDDIKQGLSSLWDSMAEGWQHMRQSASTALTGFKAEDRTNLPAPSDVDDVFYMPSRSWAMLGGDLFEDDKRVVVRIEMPGLDKDNLDIEVQGNALIVRGEKHFEREDTDGRYRVLQCAYGSFRRVFPLHTEVEIDQAQATYRNGVLRVELPKSKPSEPRRFTVKVE